MHIRQNRTSHITCVLVLVAFLAAPLAAQDVTLESEDQKVLYALGVALAQNVAVFGLTEEEVPYVLAGLKEGALGKPQVDLQTYGPKLQALAQQRQAKAAEGEKAASQAFLDEAAKAPGAVKTDSGLIITEMTAGTGANPAASDTVTVHYHGTLRDGTVFDSSVDRGQPATFPLSGVIPCWTEGVQKIKVGGKSRLVCPSGIAYGDQGRPPKIPGGAVLVFEVELLSIGEGQ